jgi:hypothetical protein
MGHRRLAGAQAHDRLGSRVTLGWISPEMERRGSEVESVLLSSIHIIVPFGLKIFTMLDISPDFTTQL